MSFLNPIAWIGLAALMVPVIIHFLSKKKKNLIYFGSVRFLEASESPAAKSIQFSQWILFVIRCAIIIGIVGILAAPNFPQQTSEKNIFIESGIETDSTYVSLMNDLANKKYQLFNIGLTDKNSPLSFHSAYSFITYLNAHSDSVLVYSRSSLHAFHGSSISMNNNIEWQIVPYQKPMLHSAEYNMGDQSYLLEISSDSENFEVTSHTTNVKTQEKTINFTFINSVNSKPHKDKMLQLLTDLSVQLPFVASFADTIRSDKDWIIMIDTVIQVSPSTNKIFWEIRNGGLFIQEIGDNTFSIKGEINRENLLRSDFSVLLSKLLVEDFVDLDQHDFRSYRPPTDSVEINTLKSGTALSNEVGSNMRWLWILILLFLGVERWLAFKNQ